jgi:NAD(P)H-hydrate epimerase
VTEARRALAPPALPDDAHKGDAGRVLVLAGSRLMPGAALLVARGAARGGAGLVTVGCLDPSLLAILPVALPEAVLLDLARLGELSFALEAGGHHAVVAGPGTGRGGRGAELARLLVRAELSLPLVLDADALTNLAGDPEALRAHRGPLVITPHPGEARALLGREVPRDQEGRVEAARELAARAGAVVCLKGAGTVVTDGELVYVNDTGNWGMAKGGSGDVLSGIVAAYLAHPALRSDSPDWTAFDAAASAVRAHGLAGDLAAAHLGRRAMIPSDLLTWLGPAQKRLEG